MPLSPSYEYNSRYNSLRRRGLSSRTETDRPLRLKLYSDCHACFKRPYCDALDIRIMWHHLRLTTTQLFLKNTIGNTYFCYSKFILHVIFILKYENRKNHFFFFNIISYFINFLFLLIDCSNVRQIPAIRGRKSFKWGPYLTSPQKR